MLAKYWEKRRRKLSLWLDYRHREICHLAAATRGKTKVDKRPMISMRQLGRQGRFGNWMFQYMFLKCYALKHDLQVQTPHWPGHILFDCNDRLPTVALPTYPHTTHSQEQEIPLLQQDGAITSVDFTGYFQYHTRVYAPYQNYIQKLLTPRRDLVKQLDSAIQQILPSGSTLVGLHIRRGDFGADQFYITPTSWYVQLLQQIWPTLHKPVLYIATDEPKKVLNDFEDYHPTSSKDLGLQLLQTPYFLDFYILTQARVLAIPNSTFSFVAAMLNRNLQEVYRSHLSDPLESPPFRQIDPWHCDVLDRHIRVENFPNVAGIGRTT